MFLGPRQSELLCIRFIRSHPKGRAYGPYLGGMKKYNSE